MSERAAPVSRTRRRRPETETTDAAVEIGDPATASMAMLRALGNQAVQRLVLGRSAPAALLLPLAPALGNRAVQRLVQAAGAAALVQRRGDGAAACPRRPAGEAAQSRTADGILSIDAVFIESDRKFTIQDFPVNSAAVPSGFVASSGWQRAMSLIIGDRTSKLAVSGYTDCTGTHPENLSLRRQRAEAVIAALPRAVQAHVLFSGAYSTTDFLDTNATAEGRARNRAVSVTYALNTTRQDPGQVVPRAANLDEYLYLVRSLEQKLNLTAPGDTPKALSALRQIYYGSADWSASRHRVWDSVITDQPWSPGTDPTPQLGAPLMQALKASQVVEGIDIGHVLTGIDAMMKPATVDVKVSSRLTWGTSVPNEAWATWAGDVGSAASEWAMDQFYLQTRGGAADYFRRLASDSDLLGDIDSFALRAGFNPGGAPSTQLNQKIQLRGPLSNALLDYYRVTNSPLGQARQRRVRSFIEAYGGSVTGGRLQNRAALEAALRPQADEFMRLASFNELLKRGDPPPQPANAPSSEQRYNDASTVMTRFFVDWLERQAQAEAGP